MQITPWGKFLPEHGSHHLAHHCADVATCFMALTELPLWRNRLEHAAGAPLDEQQLQRLAVLVFLHDIGKLLPGFQAKIWDKERITALAPDERCRCTDALGHSAAGAQLFLDGDPPVAIDDMMASLGIDHIAEWADEVTLANLLLASFAHHGRPINLATLKPINARCWRPLGTYNPLPHANTIGDLMRHWFAAAFEPAKAFEPANAVPPAPLPGSAAFQHLFAGLVALSDWIGSDAAFFPYRAEASIDYWQDAQANAQRALQAIGIDTQSQRRRHQRQPPTSFQRLTGHDTPNAQQAAIADISPNTQMVILEAETGSGKTEAALWHFIRLYEAGKVDGLYFAVPTRTAAVQLHKRVHETAKRVFKEEPPQTVLAIPGYYVAGDHQGQPLAHWRVLWDDGERETNEAIARRWAAEHSKRYLAAQLAVGTIDQAMLSALPVKHAHLRASSLARSLLVIDEVHASDIYMTTIQQDLVRDHLALGGHVLAMSATLGSVLRAKWLAQTPPSYDEARQIGYPAIWLKGEAAPLLPTQGKAQAQAKPQAKTQPNAPNKSIAMSCRPTMAAAAVAQQALDAARQGAKILIIRNTVDEAIKCHSAVEDLLGQNERHLLFQLNGVATLHHGRFAAEDRKGLDNRVEALFGKSRTRPEHGLILIGTQTLEQSLDICADYMITDLCPVDVLLQRLGRLHRHDNKRPAGFATPRCLVLLPDEGLEKCLSGMINGLGSFKKDGCLSGIYIDVAGLELTRRQIIEQPVWHIPAMNRELVESATHPMRIEALCSELGEHWQSYQQQEIGGKLADTLQADLAALDRSKDFINLSFPGSEEQIRTRLGDEGFQVELDPPAVGPFGDEITRLVIPAHWSRGLAHDADVEWRISKTDELEFTITTLDNGSRSFRYNRRGLSVDEQR